MDPNGLRSLKYLGLFDKNQTALKNETSTTGRTTEILVACGRSDVTPMMVTRSATVDVTAKW
jgi:hypothetical protein